MNIKHHFYALVFSIFSQTHAAQSQEVRIQPPILPGVPAGIADKESETVEILPGGGFIMTQGFQGGVTRKFLIDKNGNMKEIN